MATKRSAEERLWAKVEKSDSLDGCWLWVGAKLPSGHGVTSYQGHSIGAHRLAWILTNGPIAAGLHVCHNCPGGDNPNCVRPSHMFLGTAAENIADYHRKQAPIKRAASEARIAAFNLELATEDRVHRCEVCGAPAAREWINWGGWNADGTYAPAEPNRRMCADLTECLRRVCVLGAAA